MAEFPLEYYDESHDAVLGTFWYVFAIKMGNENIVTQRSPDGRRQLSWVEFAQCALKENTDCDFTPTCSTQ